MDQALDMKEGEMKQEMQMQQEPKKPKHTATPWHEGETASNKLAIFSQMSPVAIAEILTFPHHKNGPANAAFILRAVNNYDALIAALKSISDGDMGRCECEHDTEFCCATVGEYCPKCIADAALSAAQEQS